MTDDRHLREAFNTLTLTAAADCHEALSDPRALDYIRELIDMGLIAVVPRPPKDETSSLAA